MLAGAPLLVAQLGALEFRKSMLSGNSEVLRTLRLGTRLSAAEFIKKLSQAPPLAVLRLLYDQKNYDFTEQLLQQADDLDYVQDVLTTTGNSLQLNPVLNGVLAGFNRRRRQNRFKYGNSTLEFDRLRFAGTASKADGDLCATDVGGAKEKKEGKRNTEGVKDSSTSGAICRFYQKTAGCRRTKCNYVHKCIICNRTGHGAINCYARTKLKEETVSTSTVSRTEERPPDPRTRRARAILS